MKKTEGVTPEHQKLFDADKQLEKEARFKAQDIRNMLNEYTIPESVDREAIAQDIVSEILNELNGFGTSDWLTGKRIEFWEKVKRNL